MQSCEELIETNEVTLIVLLIRTVKHHIHKIFFERLLKNILSIDMKSMIVLWGLAMTFSNVTAPVFVKCHCYY